MRYWIDLIESEAEKAEARFGPFTSSHEGYGVLMEEVWELLAAVHANDRASVEREAVQVAAVALRLAACCEDGPFQHRSGFHDGDQPTGDDATG